MQKCQTVLLDSFSARYLASPPKGRRGHQTYTTMSAILIFVESSHPQTADVAGGMVAGRNRVVGYGIGTDEADISVVVCILLGDSRLASLEAGLVNSGSEVLGGRV